MKSGKTTHEIVVLSFRSVVLTLCVAALWALAAARREWFVNAYCSGNLERCAADLVPFWDHWVLALPYLSWGEELSNATQALSGVAAIGAWVFVALILRGQQRLLQVISQGVWLLQVTVWNGFFVEVARLTVARPRPFVFQNPAAHADSVGNYVSFYSGHTSFSAAITLAAYLLVRESTEHKGARIFFGALAVVLPLLTAIGRVWGTRHFPSDVAVAWLCGSLVAWGMFRLHGSKRAGRPRLSDRAAV